jgi:hypothetical protein
MADLFGQVLDLAFHSSRLSEYLAKVLDYEPMSDTEHSELRSSRKLNTGFSDFISDGNKDISIKVRYSFYNRRRINILITGKKYSSTNTFKSIYRRLVVLNNGVSFLDVYFDLIFPVYFHNEIKELTLNFRKQLQEEYDALVQSQHLTKKGAPDRRFKVYKKLSEFESVKTAAMDQHFDTLSLKIKHHIQVCLMTGLIPLSFRLKPSTITRKARLGLSQEPFFATGQLVDNLIISYTVEEAA